MCPYLRDELTWTHNFIICNHTYCLLTRTYVSIQEAARIEWEAAVAKMSAQQALELGTAVEDDMMAEVAEWAVSMRAAAHVQVCSKHQSCPLRT
eukprot:COSAG05_NODE_29_length_29038_cov_1237.466985_30_plen_94_part_00